MKLGNLFLGALNFGRVDVADGRDFGVAFLYEPIQHVNQALSAVAQPKHSNAHPRDWSDTQVKGVASDAGGFDFGRQCLIQRDGVGRTGKGTQGATEPEQAAHSKKVKSAHVPKIGKPLPYAFNS